MQPRSILIGALVVALLAIGGGSAAYVLFLRGDDVAPLALPSTAAGASSGTSADSSAGSGAASGAVASMPAASGSTLDAASVPGTWAIGPNSVVGYRVRERLASLLADSDAVGRTSTITGTATITGSGSTLTVSKADFTVDMTSLASDKQMRDNRLRTQGIETNTYTTSTFILTQPLALPANALSGSPVSVTIHGDLTLHGVTKTVDVAAKAQVSGSVIQVLGTLTFPFSDFNIVAPSIGGFVTVQDTGTLEFLVNLTKS